MTNNNSLAKDPLTNPNGSLPPLPDFGNKEGGYVQDGQGTIANSVPQNQMPEPQISQIQQVTQMPQAMQVPQAQQVPQEMQVPQNNPSPLGQLPTLDLAQNAPLQTIPQMPVIAQPATVVTQPTTIVAQPTSVVTQPINTNTQPVPQVQGFIPPTNGGIGPIDIKDIGANKVEPIKKSDGKMNTMVALVIVFVVLLIFALIIGFLLNNLNNKKTTDNTVLKPTIKVTQTVQNIPGIDSSRIQVLSPQPNQVILKSGTTLALKGQMKGFFEGTMGYRITDEFGGKIMSGVITAESDNYTSFANFNLVITIPPFPESHESYGGIQFFETNMKDGSENVVATVILRLQ